MESRDGLDGVAPAFLQLPALVYADDPDWIPEIAPAVESAFSSANAYFERGRARTWAEPGQVRAAGFFAPDVRVEGRAPAFFGYFEMLPGAGAVDMLFDEIKVWARESGADDLIGPVDFTTFGKYRVVEEVHQAVPPFDKEPYTPLAYAAELQRLGFTPRGRRYLSKSFTPAAQAALARGSADAYRHFLSLGYRVIPLTPDVWLAHLRDLYTLVDDVFGEQFAYTTPSFEEFAVMCGPRFAARACPELSALVKGPEGDLAGFMVNWADFGPLVRQAAGAARVGVDELDHATHFPILLERCGAKRTWLGRIGGAHPNHRGRRFVYAMAHLAFSTAVADPVWDGSIWGIGTEGNGVVHAVGDLGHVTRYYRLYGCSLTEGWTGSSRTAP